MKADKCGRPVAEAVKTNERNSKMADKVRWGIIGAGGIAKAFARGVAHSRTGALQAIGSRSLEKAKAFGEEFKVAERYGSYEALLADTDVDAVYIATPHPMHGEWAIKAAEAGKHVLCEKPLTVNHPQAMAVVEAAAENDVFLMEAFMYRCHPQTARLVELIKSKAIGDVRVIQATFAFNAGWNEASRLLDAQLGGGGILDVGCYCASMARLVAGATAGKGFENPVEVKGCGRIGTTGVDEWAVAVLKFPGDIVATLSTGVLVGQENVVRIYGSEGHIVMPDPWIPSREGGSTKILVYGKGAKSPEEIEVKTGEWLYGIEADAVATGIAGGQATPPAMTCADSLGNMKTLDAWRESIGLVYPCEKPEGLGRTVAGRTLSVRAGNSMKYGSLAGVEKKISRTVMGVDNQPNIAHAAVMFDDFIERGGNTFDTAHVYGGGRTERLLGQWMKTRGIREDVVVIGKGAHTPWCNPVDLTKQLYESLDRLGTDYLDVYFMHRDNLEVPVGEFVDVLNEHKRAGRIRAFGGSNWCMERVEAANEYARDKGLTGFSAISNNFSLARMICPVWDGCISASDAAYRKWLKEKGIALFAWSSQARGFFTERAHPEKLDDTELVKCWYSEDNFRRQARARELAAKKGVDPINIALAYVLCQDFATFALVGPRVLSETRVSLRALEVELTPAEVKWLNLEA